MPFGEVKIYLDLIVVGSLEAECYMLSNCETFDPRFSVFMLSAGSLVSFCSSDVSTDNYIALGFQTMAAIHKNVCLRHLLMVSMNFGQWT